VKEMSIHKTKERLGMGRVNNVVIANALVLIGFAVAGCSSPSIVGEWHGEADGHTLVFTMLSDGTGDATEAGPTIEIKWKRVKDKFEITFLVDGRIKKLEATLRENNTLAVIDRGAPEQGLLVFRKKTDGR